MDGVGMGAIKLGEKIQLDSSEINWNADVQQFIKDNSKGVEMLQREQFLMYDEGVHF